MLILGKSPNFAIRPKKSFKNHSEAGFPEIQASFRKSKPAIAIVGLHWRRLTCSAECWPETANPSQKRRILVKNADVWPASVNASQQR